MKVFLYLFLLTGIYCLSNFTSDLILSFLKENNTKFSFFLVCWKNHDKVKIQKHILKQEMYVRTAFLPAKVGSVAQVKDEQYEKISYIVDLSCESTHLILQEASQKNKFMFLYSWFLIGDRNTGKKDIKFFFKDIRLRMDMNMKIALPRSYDDRYDIFEIYDPGLEVDFKVNKVGNFNNGGLVYSNKNISYYESRMNMSGVLIRSGNVFNYTASELPKYLNELKYREIPNFLLFNLQLFLYLRDIHNFHFNETCAESIFGSHSNGTVGGVGRLVYEEKVDVHTAGGTPLYYRMDFFDFISPYLKYRTCFLYVNINAAEPGTQVLKPFAVKTWYCTMGILLVTAAAMKIVYMYEDKFHQPDTQTGFLTSLIITISAFAQQGWERFSSRQAARIIFLNLLLLSTLLYNYYTSALVSSFLNAKHPAITTFKGLYESNLKFAMEPVPYMMGYIMALQNSTYEKKLYLEKVSSKSNFFQLDEGLVMIKKGGIAYHTEVGRAYPIIARTFDQENICNLVEVVLNKDFVEGLALKKKSQYRKLFRISLMKMWERGIFEREYDVWTPNKPKCMADLRAAAISGNDLFVAYLILAVGILLAAVIFIYEIIRFKMVDMKKLTFTN